MDVKGISVGSVPVSAPVTAPVVTTAPASAPVSSAPAPTVSSSSYEAHSTDSDITKHVKSSLEAAKEKINKQNGVVPRDELDKALEQINRSLASFNREMQVSVHDRLNRIMVKVMDTEKNKVIREIPPEKVLDAFATALELAGVLLDEKR